MANLPIYHAPGNQQLTARELEIELLLCRGLSHKNIADRLGRSLKTISAHISNLYPKRGVNTRVQLLLAYLQRQGIDLERIHLTP